MKFVDNLLEVDPKDIRYISDKSGPIQTIIKVSKPCYESYAVVVIFEDGDTGTYTIDGRYREEGEQKFIFKPKKVKRLKPLHVVLAEINHYQIDNWGYITFKEWPDRIVPKMLRYFGTTNIPSNWDWDEKWIEEVDEEGGQ